LQLQLQSHKIVQVITSSSHIKKNSLDRLEKALDEMKKH